MLHCKELKAEVRMPRDDFKERDDENWLCHSLYDPIQKTLSKRDVNFEPAQVDTFEPKVRTY